MAKKKRASGKSSSGASAKKSAGKSTGKTKRGERGRAGKASRGKPGSDAKSESTPAKKAGAKKTTAKGAGSKAAQKSASEASKKKSGAAAKTARKSEAASKKVSAKRGGSKKAGSKKGRGGKPSPVAIEEPEVAVEETPDDLLLIIEALLFGAHEPLTAKRIAQALGKVAVSRVEQALEDLEELLAKRRSPLQVVEIAGGHRLVTRPEFAPYLSRLFHKAEKERLSGAALETLAIVAYRQPVTRADVEGVRGVQAGPVLRALKERRLIKVVGRAPIVGRPQQYGTSRKFLDLFGLSSLKDLPKVFAPDGSLAAEGPEEDLPSPGAEPKAEEAPVTDSGPGPESESALADESPEPEQEPDAGPEDVSPSESGTPVLEVESEPSTDELATEVGAEPELEDPGEEAMAADDDDSGQPVVGIREVTAAPATPGDR